MPMRSVTGVGKKFIHRKETIERVFADCKEKQSTTFHKVKRLKRKTNRMLG